MANIAKNPITGDKLQSKPTTRAYEDGWDRIFAKQQTEWPTEDRIDAIAQNGNDGLHYEKGIE